MSSEIQLAVVIPAYKAEYLAEALASLAAQTDKRFRVYLGDDASPGPLGEICNRYAHKLDLVYHRFPENLGRDSLVDQWHRCIQLSSEPWVWLFSDDDVMEAGCVEAFYGALDETKGKYDLYRFNTSNIDEAGRVVRICPPHPLVESGLEFAYHRLCRNRESYVSEYVFSREVFRENDGMVRFPLAWCSDDASWIAFAGDMGIFTIYGPRVFWRQSQLNISFTRPRQKEDKLKACALFLKWLNSKYDQENIKKELNLDLNSYHQCCADWMLFHLNHQVPLNLHLWVKLSQDPSYSYLGNRATRIYTLVSGHFVFFEGKLFNAATFLIKKIFKPVFDD